MKTGTLSRSSSQCVAALGLWGQPAPPVMLLTAEAVFAPSWPCPASAGDEQCVLLMLFLQANQGLLLAWQMRRIGLPGAHIPACLRVSASALLPAKSESGEEESRRSSVPGQRKPFALSPQRLYLPLRQQISVQVFSSLDLFGSSEVVLRLERT